MTTTEKSTDIAEVVATNPVAVLVDPKVYGDFYKHIKEEVKNFKPDVSTVTSRKAIASMAYKVTRTKTAIDNAGKKLNEEARAKIAKVDEQRRKIRADLDELSAEVRLPLTEWEDARASAEQAIADIRQWADCEDEGLTLEELSRRVERTYQCTDFMDLTNGAEDALRYARDRLQKRMEEQKRRDEERAELERLRREAEEREAAERARLEAEARAEAERAAAEAAKRREEEAAERARIAEREAAERALEEERRRAAEAVAKAEREKQALIEAQAREERERAAAEKAAAEEQARREADQQHRTQVKTAAKEALIAVGADEDLAKKIVLAVIAGEIPGVTLRF